MRGSDDTMPVMEFEVEYYDVNESEPNQWTKKSTKYSRLVLGVTLPQSHVLCMGL